MNKSESYVYYILNKYSKIGHWKFYINYDENGDTCPQSKMYPDLGYWVSYPDFEYYCENKLTLLVEVKGYDDFFNCEYGNVVAMKLKNYNGYIEVMREEGVDVRICFSIKLKDKIILYWESLKNMIEFPNTIRKLNSPVKNYKTGDTTTKKENYILWSCFNFRTDYENLPIV